MNVPIICRDIPHFVNFVLVYARSNLHNMPKPKYLETTRKDIEKPTIFFFLKTPLSFRFGSFAVNVILKII